jgi:hypothetical protein
MSITLEARRDFVEGVVPLSLWVARRLCRHGMAFEEAIRRTIIYRLTSLCPGRHDPAHAPAGGRDLCWEELLGQMQAVFARYNDSEDTAALEREGLELLWPVLEPGLELDVRSWPLPFEKGAPRERPFGFFTYYKSSESPTIGLHLANPFAPRSPFADPQARAAELRGLLDEATDASRFAGTRPAPVRVGCGSWLCSFPPFLQLFPPEFASSAEPEPLHHSYGWWGQFINRSGGFHRRNAEYLRRTGDFPYGCVWCACEISELRAHLDREFAAKPHVGGDPE